jgi:hypothetical protein
MKRLRHKQRRISWKDLCRRYCGGHWWPSDGEVILFNPTDAALPTTATEEPESPRRGQPQHEDYPNPPGTQGEPDAVKPHVRFGGPPKRTDRKISTALRSDLMWSRSATARSRTGRSTPRSGSACPGRKTSSASGAGTGGEDSKFWMAVLTDLKNRGVQDVFFLVCDGLKGLPVGRRPIRAVLALRGFTTSVPHVLLSAHADRAHAIWQC